MSSAKVPRSAGQRICAGLLALAVLCVAGLSLFSKESTQGRVASGTNRSVVTHRGNTANTEPKSVPVIRHLSYSQQASFSVFNTPPEDLPQTVRQAIGHPIYGINWRLAQSLPIKTPARVWAVPGNGYICLLSLQENRAVGVSCGRTKMVQSSGLSTTFLSERGASMFRTSRRVIVGIAPSRTGDVIAQGSESSARIPVVDGTFIWRDNVPDPPENLRLVAR